jgi:hypothetical protein
MKATVRLLIRIKKNQNDSPYFYGAVEKDINLPDGYALRQGSQLILKVNDKSVSGKIYDWNWDEEKDKTQISLEDGLFSTNQQAKKMFDEFKKDKNWIICSEPKD